MTTTNNTEATMTKTLKDFAFGFEIETTDLGIAGCVRAIESVIGSHGSRSLNNYYQTQTVTMADGRNWKVETDSSISGYRGAEVVSPKMNYSDIETLQNVIRALRAAGARVNSSCGIHIHVDGAPFLAKPRALANLCKLVNQQDELMRASFGTLSSRNHWCRPFTPEWIAALEATRGRSTSAIRSAWYSTNTGGAQTNTYHDSRYHGANLHSLFNGHGTVEFRYFNATLHAGVVKAYIQFVLALAAKAYNSKSARSAKRKDNANLKYAFRCFLLSLKLNGAEFKTARLHLLKNLPGTQNGKATNGRAAGYAAGSNGGA